MLEFISKQILFICPYLSFTHSNFLLLNYLLKATNFKNNLSYNCMEIKEEGNHLFLFFK